MQISRCPNSSRGLTLLEILIVLFIASLITGVAVVSLPAFTQSDYFERESERIRALVRILSEKAVMESTNYGLQINRYENTRFYGHEFFQESEEFDGWQSLNEVPFKIRRLDEKLTLSLRIEGKSLDISGRDTPPVLILSSGEVTPFELDIRQATNNGLLKTLGTDGYSDVDWLN